MSWSELAHEKTELTISWAELSELDTLRILNPNSANNGSILLPLTKDVPINVVRRVSISLNTIPVHIFLIKDIGIIGHSSELCPPTYALAIQRSNEHRYVLDWMDYVKSM